MVYDYIPRPLEVLLPTLMLIGRVVPKLEDQLLDTICFLVRIYYPGCQNTKVLYLDLVLKQNIVGLQMLSLKPPGFEIFSWNFATPPLELLLSIVIMLVQSTCPIILFNTNRQNTLRQIFTLFVTKWNWVIFEFYTCRPPLNMHASSLKGFLRLYFWISNPV